MDAILLTLCGLIIMLTAAITAWMLLAQQRMAWLLPKSPATQRWPKISVIIPARNEAQDILNALHSVLHQHGLDLEVIVVNDHSTDQTGALVEEIARGDGRVTVLHHPPLPAGWLGKANAMQAGAERATGEYLVFTDADIMHAPTCFATALAVMEQQRYDFFSFSPLWINETVWEHMNIPIYLFGFLKLLSLPGLDDPTSPHTVASGAFMLIKTTTFWDIGGFERVKGEMFDDVELARVLKAQGYRVSYWFGPACSHVRVFKNGRDAFWGTTKNILTSTEGQAVLALPLILVGIVQYWTSFMAVAVGSLTANPLLVICGLSTYLMQYGSFFAIRRLFRFHPIKLLCFPLVVVVSTCCILRAFAYQMKGMIVWRGRAIKVK